AENMDREMADGACDARTVEVEPCEIGSANFLARVHLHAVDHGEKIAATQPIAQYWPTQRRADEVVRMSRIESIDLLAPGGEGGEFVLDRPLAIGDVVDLAAKRIDRVHPVPAVPRQEPHGPIERGSGRLDPTPDGFEQRRVAQLPCGRAERAIVHA